jgi:RNA polymerase sigma-70 factor (ECF subfamily)
MAPPRASAAQTPIAGPKPLVNAAGEANGQPAYGIYLEDPHAPIYRAHGLAVLTLAGE